MCLAGRHQPVASVLQAVINALQVLKVLGPALHVSLAPAVVVLLPSIGGAACHTRAPVRAAAVSAAAALAASDPAGMLPPLLRCVASSCWLAALSLLLLT